MKNALLLLTSLLSLFTVHSQKKEKHLFKIVSYNVENFFDCYHDSLKDDKEFLPGGMHNWSYTKYTEKQAHIATVIAAIGGWNAPAIVGLCEVENDRCLHDLTKKSGLRNLHYKYIHYESPDLRGIDVALLYQPDIFHPIHQQAIRIRFPFAPKTKTRDILYVRGKVPSGDTLQIFMCHFPSRWGGELASEHKRLFVAGVLRKKVDSIFNSNQHANIVIMGDFNDYPTNKSMVQVLKALSPDTTIMSGKLYNLMYDKQLKGIGSHKMNGEWGCLDQIMVSGNLLDSASLVFTKKENCHIFEPDFLLENDKKYLGKKPFRTYVGMKYQDGYSDHLPVYLNLWY